MARKAAIRDDSMGPRMSSKMRGRGSMSSSMMDQTPMMSPAQMRRARGRGMDPDRGRGGK